MTRFTVRLDDTLGYDPVEVVPFEQAREIIEDLISALERCDWQRALLADNKPVRDFGECSADVDEALREAKRAIHD